jgi:hypothetical protein
VIVGRLLNEAIIFVLLFATTLYNYKLWGKLDFHLVWDMYSGQVSSLVTSQLKSLRSKRNGEMRGVQKRWKTSANNSWQEKVKVKWQREARLLFLNASWGLNSLPTFHFCPECGLSILW